MREREKEAGEASVEEDDGVGVEPWRGEHGEKRGEGDGVAGMELGREGEVDDAGARERSKSTRGRRGSSR